MTELERLIKAKIPCPETGIAVRQTICDICAPGLHCGIDAYIKDGKVIKVEGTKAHPANRGLLCAKGASSRQYIYREDRIKTPLKRVGKKGEGKFKEITWDEAYAEIAEKLLAARENSGADSVAFFSGYNKWFRPFLQRFAYAFGSKNYGTESSTCFTASVMTWKLNTGDFKLNPDFMHAGVYLGWAYSAYHSLYMLPAAIERARQNGLKVIIIDIRKSPAVIKQCDLFLQIRPGTDGALALGFAKILIENGWIDHKFIEEHVYGFEEYSEYVKQFDLDRVSGITGIPGDLILSAVKMMVENGPVAIHESGAPLIHHTNGLQCYRAVTALSALLGTYDKKGGQLPSQDSYAHSMANFVTMEHAFSTELKPKNDIPMIGEPRFPLWAELVGEAQSVDISRQILEGTPYPVKALFALGMNFRMTNDSEKMREAIQAVDFFVDADLFLTDTAKYADIVLPVCSSFERSEFKVYAPDYVMITKPAIEPLYDSKPDIDILFELARYMDLGDELIKSDYETCIRHMTRNLNLDFDEMKSNPYPVRVPGVPPRTPGRYLFRTPTGRFELKSTILEKYSEYGLDALPTYREPLDDADPAEYPYTLSSGVRLPNVLHSRMHDVPWPRSLRPYPTADLNDEDARALGVGQNDHIEIYTATGKITVRAKPTTKVQKGNVLMYHGYREADVNSLIGWKHNDPYSGFPGYNSVRCGIRKAVG